MKGPTLTMAPAVVEPAGSFHRSHSTPNLLTSLTKPAPSLSLTDRQRGLTLKSLPSLPAFDVPSFDSALDFDTTLFLDGRGSAPSSKKDRNAPQVLAAPVQEKAAKPEKRGRTNSFIDRPRSWLPNSKSATNIRELLAERPRTQAGEHVPYPVSSDRPDLRAAEFERPRTVERSRTVSESFATFARRSWISTSRSPSPQRRQEAPTQAMLGRDRAASNGSAKAPTPSRKRPVSTLDSDPPRSAESPKGSNRALNRASTYFTKIKQRPQSMLVKLGNANDSDNSCASSATSLAPPTATTVTDNQNSSHAASFTDSNTTVTDESSSDMPSLSRDPLWSSFKSLDSDFVKFGSKTTPQRMHLVRGVLLVFLRNYANHSSNNGLHPEEVDRRATILNKWWSGLLDMLDGRDQQPLAGVDRPALLEATTMIMMRPEWRQTTTYFMPLADRSPAERVRARSNTQSTLGSMSSSQADFLAQSAEHNVRTMFVANLLKQMALVVDRMSVRHAPLSMVNFSGKACAYAFFFAPGVAEILVRLWGLTPALIRRAADEFGLPWSKDDSSEDLVALFPTNLGALGWSSVKSMKARLKTAAKLPVLASNINWHGPWVSRWRGRDTDLFFIFCKYYHILAEDFMLPELPLFMKARAPAFVLVHSQLLANLDTTIHRQAAVEAMLGPPLADTFHGSDASAMALPLPNGNLLKSMAENRLIVLLKDFLSEESVEKAAARHTFAEGFMAVIRAATRKTSQFDTNACFTLCDFLEEALLAYDDVGDGIIPAHKYINWDLWLDVCKMILNSMNNMSEIRMLSFVFTIWNTLTADQDRKEAVCLGWLLTEETFDKLFNHWCPMVRAYYMRLLCWRICRDAGSANEVDSKIFITVASRLKTVWSHYLYLRNTAEDEGRFPPSTAPCYPTPGKKFMIIRTEVHTVHTGLFLGFDSFPKSVPGDLSGSGFGDDSPVRMDGKKRWSILGKVLSLTAGTAGAGTASSTNGGGKPTREDDFELARREIAAARSKSTPSGPPLPPKASKAGSGTTTTSDGDSTGSSPTFNEQQYVFKFTLQWHQPPAGPARDRFLTRPRLPAPAQSRVSSRARSGSPPPPAPGLPAPTRLISGLPQTGLINEAKNAVSIESSAIAESRPSFSSSFSRSLSDRFDLPTSSRASPSPSDHGSSASERERESDREAREVRSPEHLTQPVEPVGIYTGNAVYAGRSLSEWGLVVTECNGFIDRRRDEGVLGLSEVEVPTLGVEGFRKLV